MNLAYIDIAALFLFALLGANLIDNHRCRMDKRSSNNFKKRLRKELLMLSGSFTSSLGGGVIRDILLMILLVIFAGQFASPCFAFLHISSLAVVAGYILYILLRKTGKVRILQWKTVQFIINIIDGAAMGRFMVSGGDRVLLFITNSFSFSPIVSVLAYAFVCGCAVLSCIGGGVITKLICKKKISDIFQEKWMYYLTAILTSVEYTVLRMQTDDSDKLSLLMMGECIIAILAIDYNIIRKVTKAPLFQNEPKRSHYALTVSLIRGGVLFGTKAWPHRGAKFKSVLNPSKGVHIVSFAHSATILRTNKLIAVAA